MKYLIVALILASFLPLQSGMGCNMPMEQVNNEMSCHQSMDHDQAEQASNHGHKLRQKQHHSDCYFCQSGLCQNVAVFQDSVFFGNDRKLADLQCETDQRFILPMDLFLLPIKERAPPPGPKSVPVLSYDWQAFYSVFII